MSKSSRFEKVINIRNKKANFEFEYCTDNAAMIAMAAHYKYLRKDFVGYDLVPLAKLKL